MPSQTMRLPLEGNGANNCPQHFGNQCNFPTPHKGLKRGANLQLCFFEAIQWKTMLLQLGGVSLFNGPYTKLTIFHLHAPSSCEHDKAGLYYKVFKPND